MKIKRPRGRPPQDDILRKAWETMMQELSNIDEAYQRRMISLRRAEKMAQAAISQYAITRQLFNDDDTHKDIKISAKDRQKMNVSNDYKVDNE